MFLFWVSQGDTGGGKGYLVNLWFTSKSLKLWSECQTSACTPYSVTPNFRFKKTKNSDFPTTGKNPSCAGALRPWHLARLITMQIPKHVCLNRSWLSHPDRAMTNDNTHGIYVRRNDIVPSRTHIQFWYNEKSFGEPALARYFCSERIHFAFTTKRSKNHIYQRPYKFLSHRQLVSGNNTVTTHLSWTKRLDMYTDYDEGNVLKGFVI